MVCVSQIVPHNNKNTSSSNLCFLTISLTIASGVCRKKSPKVAKSLADMLLFLAALTDFSTYTMRLDTLLVAVVTSAAVRFCLFDFSCANF